MATTPKTIQYAGYTIAPDWNLTRRQLPTGEIVTTYFNPNDHTQNFTMRNPSNAVEEFITQNGRKAELRPGSVGMIKEESIKQGLAGLAGNEEDLLLQARGRVKNKPAPASGSTVASRYFGTAYQAKEQPPAGWDAQTYANFKAANPTLEPNAEDTARMLAAGTQPKSGASTQQRIAAMKQLNPNITDQQIQDILKQFPETTAPAAPVSSGGKSPLELTKQIQQSLGGASTQERIAAMKQLNPNITDQQIQDILKQFPGGETQTGTPSAGPTGTSATARQSELDRIKAELEKGTNKPSLFKASDEYTKLRKEQGVVKDEEELNSIQNEARLAHEEMRIFKSRAGTEVSEGGRIGAVSEAERNMNFRLEGLAIREQAVLSRLQTKNAYISEAIKLGQEDYNTAYRAYQDEYNKNLKIIDMYNDQLRDQQKDALTGFTTMTNLLQKSGATEISPQLSQQMDTLALQAGLPAGAFQLAMKAIGNENKIDNTKIVNGNLYMWTTDKSGEPHLKLLQSLSSEETKSSEEIMSSNFTKNNINEFGGTKKIWDLALALGIQRDKNLTRQDEINRLFNDQVKVSYIQNMLNQGYSIDEIIRIQ